MLVKSRTRNVQIVIYLFLTMLVGLGLFCFSANVFAQGIDTGLSEVGTATGLGQQDLRVTVGKIIQVFLGVLGVLALGIVLYGGFLYMTSGGSQEKVTTARKWLINGAIGLVIIFSAFSITTFIINKLSEATGSLLGGAGVTGGDDYLPSGDSSNSFIVKSVSPQGDGAPINANIKIVFSKAVNPATINSNTILVTTAGEKKVVKQIAGPVEVKESNNEGAKILSGIKEDDDVWNEKWIVCSQEYLGNTPMTVKFDVANINHEKALSVKLAFESENSGDNTLVDISCGSADNPDANVMKKDWLPAVGENKIDIPKVCYENSDEIHVRWARKGSQCIKFDYLRVEAENEEFVGGAEVAVPGTFEVYGEEKNLVKFTPSADCPADACNGQKCFSKDTKFNIKITPEAIKSNTGAFGLTCSLGSICQASFTTGNKCDAAAPVVSFLKPIDGGKVSQNAEVEVDVKSVDDVGVSNINLYANDAFYDFVAPAGNVISPEFSGFFVWETYDLALGQYKLKATSEDVNDHIGEKEISVSVLPEGCFDKKDGGILCNKDGSLPDCPACDGADCEKDADCAGECVKTCADEVAKACESNTDCTEGVACKGVCSTLPVITDIGPSASGPGNLVSIAGVGFDAFDPAKSKVFFTGPDKKYIPAELGCEGNAAWSSFQVVAKVPAAAELGPVKIVNKFDKFDTTDDDDGWDGEFIVDKNINYPGLCAVQLEGCSIGCGAGVPSDKVKAIGENFGEKGPKDFVYFGQVSASFQGGSWQKKLISGLQIPLMDPNKYYVAVSKSSCIDSGTKESCVQTEENKDKCVCEEKNSNPVQFKIIAPENLPKIDAIDPSPAALGQLITISGSYFGNKTGHVEIYREIEGQPYEWVAESGCGEGGWADDQVIVKIPENILNKIEQINKELNPEKPISAYGGDYLVRVFTAEAMGSQPFEYEIVEGAPGPGLCAVSPTAGPQGTKVDFIGEYLGTAKNYTLNFSKTGGANIECPDGTNLCDPDKDEKCACQKIFDPGAAVSSFVGWTDKLIEKAVVPSIAVSGGAFLEEKKDVAAKRSNYVNFTVGSCTAKSCKEGETCCPDGVCGLQCEKEVVYEPSEYMWLVSTGPLPILPRVLERTCWPGVLPQSPSPASGSTDACPNGLISATFNMPMYLNKKADPPVHTFHNNIVIKRCLKQGEQCDFTACDEKSEQTQVTATCIARRLNNVSFNDLDETNDYVACTIGGVSDAPNCEAGSDGCDCQGAGAQLSLFGLLQSLSIPANKLIAGDGNPGIVTQINLANGDKRYDLFGENWYQVTIKGGNSGVQADNGEFMAADYSWSFKTKKEICVPDNLLMNPMVGLIDDLYGKQLYGISGQYKCQTLALDNENWAWDVETQTEKVKFAGFACQNELGKICPVGPRQDKGYFDLKVAEGLAGGIGFETDPSSPVEISATAVPKNKDLVKLFDNLYKKAFLKIQFKDPKVVYYYPNCKEACINTWILAGFNTQMKKESFTPETVKLYSCVDAGDCLLLEPYQLTAQNIDYQWVDKSVVSDEIAELKVSLNADDNLKPNTYYRMVITDAVVSYSGVNLTGLNYSDAKASGGDCDNKLDDDADGKADFTGGYAVKDSDEAIDYVCGCYDSNFEQFISYGPVAEDKICGENDQVAFACFDVAAAKVISDQSELEKIAKDGDYRLSDLQCVSPAGFEVGASAQFDSFSWVFKTKNDAEECKIDRVEVKPMDYVSESQGEKIEYWSAPYSSPDECSATGQPLNPFKYDWNWTSSQPAVASIKLVKITPAVKPYCNDKCLSLGSALLASVCGDSQVGAGEECDDGNSDAKDGCGEKCLKEPLVNCSDTNKDFDLSDETNCCGNAKLDGNEECDQGCDYRDSKGLACVPGAADCVCQGKGKACTGGCLNAGTAAGFTCGNGIIESGEDGDDGNKKDGDGLNQKCLHEGAKYQDTDYTAAAMCGNGVLEGGEECEARWKDAAGNSCLPGVPGCELSIDHNSYCTNLCVWKGFPSCAAGCTKQVSCESGDLGCVGSKYKKCVSGANCFGTKEIPCDEGTEGCVNKVKTITCNVDITKGCENGQEKVICYAGDPECKGTKQVDCQGCDAKGEMEVSCNIKTDPACCDLEKNPTCGKQGMKKVSCAECVKDILTLNCEVGAEGCVEGKKSVGCNIADKDAGCSCNQCCGNGKIEDYDGNDQGDEECEAVCHLKGSGLEAGGCQYGEKDCVCELPAWCGAKCLNLGSSYSYDSFCGDGIAWSGEDKVCECQADADGECLGAKGAPYQVAVVPKPINFLAENPPGANVFAYNIVSKFIEGLTNITAETQEPVSNNEVTEKKAGIGKLKFRTNDPSILEKYKDLLPEVEDWKAVDEVKPKEVDCTNESALIIDNANSAPKQNETAVCRNALLYIALTKPVKTDGMKVALYEMADVACPSVSQSGAPGLAGKFANWVRLLFIEVGAAAPDKCPVLAKAEIATNFLGNTVVSVTPGSLLKANAEYTLEFSNWKNDCGQFIDPISLIFSTGAEACTIGKVSVVPQDVLVTEANHVESFMTLARAGNGQAIVEIPDIYEWAWDWQANDYSIVNSILTCSLGNAGCANDNPQAEGKKDKTTVNISTLAKNGTAVITASAKITVDKLLQEFGAVQGVEYDPSTQGAEFSGAANLQVLLCDNLWQPTDLDPHWDTIKTKLTNGVYATTYLYEKKNNIGLFYCRDFGAAGNTGDDLPKIGLGLGEFTQINLNPRFGIYFDKSFDYLKVWDVNSAEDKLAFLDQEATPWTIEAWVYNEDSSVEKFARLFYKNLKFNSKNDYQDGTANDYHVQLAFRKWGIGCKKNGVDCPWSYDGGVNANQCEENTCEFKRSIIYSLKTPNHTIKQATIDPAAMLSPGFNHVALSSDGNGGTELIINGKTVSTAAEPNTALYLWPRDAAEYSTVTDVTQTADFMRFYIGGLGKTTVPNTSLSGYLDEFKIWSEKRSADSMLDQVVDPKEETTLVGYWKLDQDLKDYKNGLITNPYCSVNYNESSCSGPVNFKFVNLTELAKEKGLLSEQQGGVWQDLTKIVEHQCNDGKDNDNNGLADTADPKCNGDQDPWEQPALLNQYFFVRDKTTDGTADGAADVVSLRIYENPEALPPDIWYQRYVPNPSANTNMLQLDCQQDQFGKYCYSAAQDGASVYMAAANRGTLTDSDGDVTAYTNNLYSNIYLLGYSLGSNAATQNIFSQLVSHVKFNINVIYDPMLNKLDVVKDMKRVTDMVLMRLYIDQYKSTHNGSVPQLQAGTYQRGKTYSIWPSWQKELGGELQQSLPYDPENHLPWSSADMTGTAPCGQDADGASLACEYAEQCLAPDQPGLCVACPEYFDKGTCYNSFDRLFAEVYNQYSFEIGGNYYQDCGSPDVAGDMACQDLSGNDVTAKLDQSTKMKIYFSDNGVYGYEAHPTNSRYYRLIYHLKTREQNLKFKVSPEFTETQYGWQGIPIAADESFQGKITQCMNGGDDDGDGLIDYPNDQFGCLNSLDDNEFDPESAGGCDKTLFVFFIDGSVSMLGAWGNDPTYYHRTILNTIVDEAHKVLQGDDYYLVHQSGAGWTTDSGWSPAKQIKLVDPASNTVTTVKEQINKSSYIGMGNMAKWIDVVFQSAETEISKGKYDRVTYVIVTDASDTGNPEAREDDIKLAKKHKANIHVVYIRKAGSNPTDSEKIFYEKYANDTGGQFFLGDANTLAKYLGDLVGKVATCKGPAVY